MPPRSVKMKRRIFGFQRRVWWPKCTPASSRSRMETTAIGLPSSVGYVSYSRRGPGAPAAEAGTRTRNGSAGSSGRTAGDSLAAAPRERRREVGRERRLDVDALAGDRVREREPRRVQELALEAELKRLAVEGVARDRQLDRRQVDADLVRAPGL